MMSLRIRIPNARAVEIRRRSCYMLSSSSPHAWYAPLVVSTSALRAHALCDKIAMGAQLG